MPPIDQTSLPIDAVLPELLRVLADSPNAVLQAAPGAGKTTRVPLALLDQPWLDGQRVIMLEPRRLAARAAAKRMADTLGEAVGETVGYRVRLDTRVGPRTRIEVVTEGLFLRQLQGDPSLERVGAVLFDEFHERSLDGDLALAFCLQAQGLLREELRLLVMSATLDGGSVAALLGDAPIVSSEGRAFPVETRWVEPAATDRLEMAVARVVKRAMMEETGSALVFLPGTGEIRRAEKALADLGLPRDVVVAPLYGDLALDQQEAAIRPAAGGQRKVVLATAIAETSLTIDGIRIVVDAGQARLGRFDPGSGMNRLETARVSRASADQRRGRAGRLEPGLCYRLWSEQADRALTPYAPPEILRADLAPLALELAAWGVDDVADLPWLDLPPAAPLAQARTLLAQLGALTDDLKITPHGRRMATLGMHPRLAHMVLVGMDMGLGAAAVHLAALLEERDPLRGIARDTDLRRRLDLLSGQDGGAADRSALRQIRESARQTMRQLRITDRSFTGEDAGRLLALAYPDRLAQKRPGSQGQYRLANGKGAVLDTADALSRHDWLAVGDLDGDTREARIYLAAPITREEIEEVYADRIVTEEVVTWDVREQAVLARRRRRLFGLVLKDEVLTQPPAEAVAAAMMTGIRELGVTALPWTKALEAWRERVRFLHRSGTAETWPDLSDEGLLASLEDWLAPYLPGISRAGHLQRLDLHGALTGLLDWPLSQALERQAPTHIDVPSGSRLPIDYSGEIPTLAVRLQELFGLAQTPTVAGVPVLLHLLSPAHRPIQVTRDLASFWANTYRDVKKDLAGRYPRHYWPDNPLEAEPTARAKRRGT
ncbi:ATP-dependent helicase HrpB [Nitrospirillum iridis]|uniref:ATP-dependent helicase HrpB n=1 Tax=Nitrospirillum iridis TaxID=765888 RepID=A0A7X0AXK6_9PROT|nr:ATP-dependent helicase HrpB [Nitrospirillum iridis]MBB6250521.1 ATP-dependent helicase HrpB [Nitrospirillum iridis]